MKKLSKILVLCMALAMLITGCGSKDDVVIRVGSLKGATSIGLLNLMDKSGLGETTNPYDFTIATAPDEIMPMMIKGELDIALLPANAAANLYVKSDKAIEVIDINTLGVLYVVTDDESIKSIADLEGRTIYSTGKGATPEAAITSILSGNKIENYSIEFKSEASEVVALMAQEEGAVAVLPQPFVTAACAQNESLKVVIDLNEEWNKLHGEDGSLMVTGVTVVRKEFADKHPEAVKAFIKEHEASALASVEELDKTAELAVKEEIIAKEPIAKKAIPACNIVCITGNDMKKALKGYFDSLYEFKPELVGGAVPEEDFYYVE